MQANLFPWWRWFSQLLQKFLGNLQPQLFQINVRISLSSLTKYTVEIFKNGIVLSLWSNLGKFDIFLMLILLNQEYNILSIYISFFKKDCLLIYLIFWLCCVFFAVSRLSGFLFSSCGAWASHCGGFSYCGAHALGTWVSLVVAHRLSCSVARRIFPDQGSNLCPLHWRWILILCTTREVSFISVFFNIYLP